MTGAADDRRSDAVTWGRIRTFLAVVDTGSVVAAATALNVTPPAVSAAISVLEGVYDVELFTRRGRGLQLTEAGRTLADYARRMSGLLTESRLVVGDPEISRLRLGSVATASEFVLPGPLAGFHRDAPHVELTLEVRPRDELFRILSEHDLDLVLAGRPPRSSGLRTLARRPNRLVVVGVAGSDWRDPRTVWLLRGHGSGTREATLSLLQRRRLEPPMLDLGTHGAVLAAAREGLGITLVHADAVTADLESGSLVTHDVPGTPLDRPWHVVATDVPTPAARRFAATLCSTDLHGEAAFTAARR